MNNGLEFCVYKTPCGYCSKFDKWCDKEDKVEISPLNSNVEIRNLQNQINRDNIKFDYKKYLKK